MKKPLFLLCFLPLSFVSFSNNFNNKKSNVNDISYKVKNDFITSLKTDTLGAFHSYSVTTGWKLLVSGSDLQDSISKYKHFVLGEDEVAFLLNPDSPDPWQIKNKIYKYTQFDTSNYLINNKVTTKEFYFDGNDAAGYYQSIVTYSFKLTNNSLFFKVDSYSYAGWCYSVIYMLTQTILLSKNVLTFF